MFGLYKIDTESSIRSRSRKIASKKLILSNPNQQHPQQKVNKNLKIENKFFNRPTVETA